MTKQTKTQTEPVVGDSASKKAEKKASRKAAAETVAQPAAAAEPAPEGRKRKKASLEKEKEKVAEPAQEPEEVETEAEAEGSSDEKPAKQPRVDLDAAADEQRAALFEMAEKMKANSLALFAELGAMLRLSKAADAKAKKVRDRVRQKEEKKEEKKRLKKANSPEKIAKSDIPVGLSDSLCAFLKLPTGSSMKKKEVVDLVDKYAKDNGLKGLPGICENKRLINCDPALTELIGAEVVAGFVEAVRTTKKATDGLDRFRLQTALKHHFLEASE